MQHVVLIMLARHVSGAEHQTLALARYLGLERRVTLLANDELAGLLAGDPFLRRYSAGLAVQRLGPAFPEPPARSLRGALSRGRLYLRLQQALGRALRALRPDVVHLVLAPTFFAYAPHFRRLPYPVVLTLAGEMRYVRHFYGAGKRLAVRHAAARADALVVCSADEMVNLAAVAPRAVSRATLIDNFTDVARFAPAAQKAPLVAFAARLHPEKGALLFVEAAARVRATHPAARFALMGRGEEDAAVAARLSALGLRDAVRRDYATDLAPLFARASVFVSCQRHENLGSSSLLEAMASGDAVVATDVGQTWRIVDERVGRRVAPSPEALAAAIGAMLDDPQGTAVLGAAARERVLAGYGPGPYVARLLSVYEQAAQRRAGAIV
ncbi:MAG TPA: glycosyltransferase family 4 protein [Chloroflexota bacterium]|nr:glycosyltransferase family 4 protein [Chloroflexota bacterium]